jgi:hypothetical protein
MPSTVHIGSDVTIANGPTELNIHRWIAWVTRPQTPVQAVGETSGTMRLGDPIGRLTIIGSVNGNTMPTPGDALTNCLLKPITGATGVTNDWACTDVRWVIDTRAGDPQMLQTEWVTTDTDGSGILSGWT